MSVSIPETSGGCGKTHSRPVVKGSPAKDFKLDCDRCEHYLSGVGKPKIIKNTPGDRDRGIPARQERVADADPHWSTTPEGTPLTPDEEHLYKLRSEQGKQQLEMLQAYAALSKVDGLNLKDYREATWLLNQTIDPLKRPRVVDGATVCADGHDNPPGVKFCNECGMSMAARGAIAPDTPGEYDPTSILPLGTLHIATLKKMCRERGLSDKGKKAELIERLT